MTILLMSFEHYPIKPFKNELTNTVSILLEVNLYSEITSFETYLKNISSMSNYMALIKLNIIIIKIYIILKMLKIIQ